VNEDLGRFWTELEQNFPLGGARGFLRELLGERLESELERAGVLVHRRVADRYPCERWGGDGCPRVVHQRVDGKTLALCGNTPAQCASLELTARDIDFLAVSTDGLASAVGKALRLRVRAERLLSVHDGYRFGAFLPEPGVKHTVYFLARCGELDYSEGVDALRTHARGRTFAILMPTDRFISENLRRQTMSAGIPLISLADTVGLDEHGEFRALTDPLRLFAGIGVATSSTHPPVAHALVRERGAAPAWRALDAAGYERLVADVASYDVVADELTTSITKAQGKERVANVSAGYFKWIRAAAEKRQRYDPGTGDEDGVAAKQLFQRARQLFDLKRSTGWSIFQTEKIDGHAVYNFAPNDSVTFAFVFIARSGTAATRFAAEDERTPLEILMPPPLDRRPRL
jgi:hypothetical protein